MMRKLGILNIGATYANQYQVQGNRQDGHKWFGTVNNFTPTPLFYGLRFPDDSPDDTEGRPIIYEVRLKVNGRYRDDILPQIIIDDVTRDRATIVTNQIYYFPVIPLAKHEMIQTCVIVPLTYCKYL